MKSDARSRSRRDLLDNDYYQGFDREEIFPRNSYRGGRPKELPVITSNFRQPRMRTQERGKHERRRSRTHTERRSQKGERRRRRRRHSGDDNNNNAVREREATDRDNPFHENFNKVIENPFMQAKDIKTSSDDSESMFNSTNQWEAEENIFGQAEGTVNTAIVDIYDSEEGCDPFLKMRVIKSFYFVKLLVHF